MVDGWFRRLVDWLAYESYNVHYIGNATDLSPIVKLHIALFSRAD
jgi:hypothetical protein